MVDKILFEKEFEYKIISADLSADGILSVVTSAQRYASQLHVFDENYEEEIFTWSASDEYIVSASADEKTKTVAAAALSANEAGEMVTTVHIFTTEAAVELAKKEFRGASVLSLEYDADGDVKLICDTVAATISITNVMQFDATPLGTAVMGARVASARGRLFDRIADCCFSAAEANEDFFDEEK